MKAFLLFLALLCPIAAGAAQSVTLAWNPNAETNLVGYRLYWGTSPRSYAQSQDVTNGVTSTVTNLANGRRYYFAVTAYTVDAESPFSDEVSYLVPLSAPRGLRVSATVQASSSPSGPWVDLATVTVPTETAEPMQFFRAVPHIETLKD